MKKINISNKLYKVLNKQKLIDKKNLIFFHNRTRDKKKLNSYKDKTDGSIILEKNLRKSPDDNFVEILKNKKKNVVYLSGKRLVLPLMMDNNKRRYFQFFKYFKNKKVLDFGCGYGELLTILKKKKICKLAHGVEIRKEVSEHLNKNNITYYNDIKNIKIKYDVITLFHVLEHISNPIDILNQLKKNLKKNGKIIVEVPSCTDLLLRDNSLKKFRDFFMWSEHLIIYSENKLKKIIKKSGYKKIDIKFYQRYGLANHLGWLVHDGPVDNSFYKKFLNSKIEKNYKKILEDKKQTDTLIAFAKK